MTKRPWSDFSDVNSKVIGACDPIDDLVTIASYRQKERSNACDGNDPIIPLLAYAQDVLIYSKEGRITRAASAEAYANTDREDRINKFGLAYRPDAEFWLHSTLADIVVGAAIHLYHTQGWHTVLYDGLRTVEGAYTLYQLAPQDDIDNGLLALPGYSAHNKGLAIDSMMLDSNGCEVDMGAHFDHANMLINNRTYDGDAISDTAKKNRLIKEAAFLRSAFTQGHLIAPLRNEFWDDRLPENTEDLWRVLDSAARIVGISLLDEEDEQLRKTDRKAFKAKWEDWNYARFQEEWRQLFRGKTAKLEALLGVKEPPAHEQFQMYHGNYHPIYDRDLRTLGKHLTIAEGEFE